jgi:hypothetical protein
VALIAADLQGTPPPEPSLRRFAEDGRAWATQAGFPLIEDEPLLVEIGYAVVTQGSDQPDLTISICERLGLPYRVTEKKTKRGGFTMVTRRVTVLPNPEPDPQSVMSLHRSAESAPPTRDWGKGRDVKLDLRLSETERDDIAAAAAAKGMSRSEYIRRTLWQAMNADRAWQGKAVDPGWLSQMQEKFERLRYRGPFNRR